MTVAFTCEDNLSGVATCPTEETVGGNVRDQSVTSGVATDRAGNEAAGKRVDGINIDALAPTTLADTTCTRVNDWCTGDEATVKLTASDQLGLSGVKEIRYQVNGGAEQVAAGPTTSVAVPLNGEGEATVRYWAVDFAGNAEDVKTASLKWDNIAPVVTPVLSPLPNVGGWNRDDVTVSFLATDTGSGVKDGSVTPDVMVSDRDRERVDRRRGARQRREQGIGRGEVKLDKTAPGIAGDRHGRRHGRQRLVHRPGHRRLHLRRRPVGHRRLRGARHADRERGRPVGHGRGRGQGRQHAVRHGRRHRHRRRQADDHAQRASPPARSTRWAPSRPRRARRTTSCPAPTAAR